MKRFPLLSPILALMFSACAPTSPQQQSAPPTPAPVVEQSAPTSPQQQNAAPTPAPVAEQSAPQSRVIPVTAELWKWTPSVIQAKQGEIVTLQVTGVSGTHGFSVPDLGINETIFTGKTVNIPLPTDKAGTFDFRCSIQCGSGHNDMTGQIIIES